MDQFIIKYLKWIEKNKKNFLDKNEIFNTEYDNWTSAFGMMIETLSNSSQFDFIFTKLNEYAVKFQKEAEFYNSIIILIKKSFFIKFKEKDLRQTINFFSRKNRLKVFLFIN